jgi:hypothetical protein
MVPLTDIMETRAKIWRITSSSSWNLGKNDIKKISFKKMLKPLQKSHETKKKFAINSRSEILEFATVTLKQRKKGQESLYMEEPEGDHITTSKS